MHNLLYALKIIHNATSIVDAKLMDNSKIISEIFIVVLQLFCY